MKLQIAALVVALFATSLFVSVQGVEKVVTDIVKCETTKGELLIHIYRDWAPLGADRFKLLVEIGFFRDIGMFRTVKGFLSQFGISDKKIFKYWHVSRIKDDENKNLGIKKHYLSFAGAGPDTRSTQMFIALEDLNFLGKSPWETPFGEVVEGHDVLEQLYTGYGENPKQQMIHVEGNEYLRREFPNLDYIQECYLVEEEEEL
jgi:peptidyl-prolyl cis-trans isomerase A (cyclophilin A)